jgi:pimeloyl-ACP methyl ester carboxylesterase
MNARKITRYATVRDGTRVAWHTHLDDAPESEVLERPTLILTNGLGTSENFWRHLVHVFSRDFRVVHWDYRGHGASEVSISDDYSVRSFADDLTRVTEAVIASGHSTMLPIHVGFSMGVAVSLEFYRNRPDLTRAMVLIGGPPDAPYSDSLPFRIPGAKLAVRGVLRALSPFVVLSAPAVHAVSTSRVGYYGALALGLVRRRAQREDVEQFAAAFAQMDPAVFWKTLQELMRAKASDVLPLVRVPVLVVGASHDWFVPRGQVERMGAKLATAHHVVIEDAGHAVLIEAGPEVCATIRLFLRRIGASRAAA